MRTSTLRSAAIGAAVGIGFIAVGSARADDNSSTACVATTAEAAGAPAAGAAVTTAAPTTAAATATTAAATATTAAAVTPTSAAAPTTAAAGAATTAAATPTTAAAAPAGDGVGLAPGATIQQMQAALVPVLGATTDITGELATLGVTPPTGVPTPDGSTVESVSIYYYPNAEDPERSYYSATLVFTSAVPAAEMITRYQTDLVAAGYVQTADSVENEEDRQERFLTYDIPNSTYDGAELTVAVVDGDTDFAQIDIIDSVDPAIVEVFSSWPTGLPLIDQATEMNDASLRLDSFGGDYTASVRTSWTLPIPAADAHTQLLAALPSTPYTIDPDYDESEDSVYLQGGEFEYLSVYTSEGYPEDTSYYSVSADFDVQL